MGSHETLSLLFAGAGSAALAWGGFALAGAADLRALLWVVAGALALRVSLRFSGVGVDGSRTRPSGPSLVS